MIVVVDSSVLIAASILWTYESESGSYRLKGKAHGESNALFESLNSHKEITCIITKTVEIEAKSALEDAVKSVLEYKISKNTLPDFLLMKYNLMTLQDIVLNASMDRLEEIIEEYSTRLPIDICERDEIKTGEIIPFFDELIPKTSPFIPAPFIPRTIRGSMNGKEDILRSMMDALPKGGIIYKGYPENKDLILMAESVYICRNHRKNDELVYIASLDNNLKPNPKFIGSPVWPYRKLVGIDSTVRDMLEKKFGFRGEHPKQLLEELSGHP